MTPARRLAVLGGALLLTVAPIQAPVANAAPGDWVVEDWSGPVAAGSDGQITVSGTLVYEPRLIDIGGRITGAQLTLTRTPALAGCPVAVNDDPDHYLDDDVPPPVPDGESPPQQPAEPFRFAFEITVQPRCNGSYVAAVVGTFDGGGPPQPGQSDDVTSPPIEHVDGVTPVAHTVDVAPPTVERVVAASTAGSQVVDIAWQAPAGYGTGTSCTATDATVEHPDFIGYVVQRSVDGAAFTTLPSGSVSPSTQCFSDTVPADANLAQYRYRVLPARAGSAAAVLADGDSSPIATVVVGPAPPTTTATTARPPRTGSTGGGGGVSVGGGRGSTGNAAAGTVPPVPDDGTFEETLDYDEEPGEEAAQLPDDAEAFLDFVPSPGPGILVPFAIAECLAVWAFHLRYLARRADDGF